MIDVRPVTKATLGDFVRLFETRGSPHFCWCVLLRFEDAQKLEKAEKKARMQALVRSGTPIGVLAYDDGEPVGWCSIAPRETFAKLRRSRTMPRVTPETTPTWTVTCFFVRRSHRKSGVARALLDGAVAYAREEGAVEIEGYPFDTAGLTTMHQGPSSVFAACGFEAAEGRRWKHAAGKRRAKV